MITDAQYNAWLANPTAIRTLLIDVDVRPAGAGADITRYLTTGSYVTGAGDTPAHQLYLPKAVATVTTTETLPLDGSASMTIGEISIFNNDGALDSWLQDIWVNRKIRGRFGDPTWALADFRDIFNGVVADIGSPSRDRLSIKLRDKFQRLNNALIETKLSDVITNPTLATLANKDATFPVGVGEAHNITPLLTDPATLEYTYHYGAANGLTSAEARDAGIPVAVTETPGTGKFKLLAAPAGAVTCSIQGDKTGGTYVNTISPLVQRLVTNYGKSTDRFTAADLDLTQLAAFDTAHPQPVGLWFADRTNVLSACQQLATSVGAQINMTRTGKLQLLQIDLSSLTSTFDIRPHQMKQQDLSIASRTEVVAAVKLNYCRNYTPQPGLLTTISATDKEDFALEWHTSTIVDTATRDLYKLSTDPVAEDTALLRKVDADAEATRRLNLKKVPHAVYRFNSAAGSAEMLQLVLGQIVTVYHPRFNLAAGGVGMVVSLTTNWATGRVEVGVLV